jgi:hypothetical protein
MRELLPGVETPDPDKAISRLRVALVLKDMLAAGGRAPELSSSQALFNHSRYGTMRPTADGYGEGSFA